MESANTKTGNMIQTWILVKAENPVSAIKSGNDKDICFNCPLKGEKGKERGCYVNLGQAPLAVWKAYTNGKYSLLTDYSVFSGRMVRFGAYGDPSAVPVKIWRQIAKHADGWTGYTHQWRKVTSRALSAFVMASVENENDARLAQSKGWRTFRVRSADTETAKGEVECVSEKGIECADCGLCCGNSINAKSVSIPAHGTGAKYINN